MLNGTTIILTVHILLLVGWFGVDIAVAVCAWMAARTGLDADTRLAVSKLSSVMQIGPMLTPFAAAPVAIVLLRWSSSTAWGARGIISVLIICVLMIGAMARALSVVDRSKRLRLALSVRLMLALSAWAAVVSSVLAGTGKGLIAADATRWKTVLFGVAVAAGALAGEPLRDVIDNGAVSLEVKDGPNHADRLRTLQRGVRTSLLLSAVSWVSLLAAVVIATNRAG